VFQACGLRAWRTGSNMAKVREYFALFDRMDLLDELFAQIADELS
jgi:hypothetical protein